MSQLFRHQKLRIREGSTSHVYKISSSLSSSINNNNKVLSSHRTCSTLCSSYSYSPVLKTRTAHYSAKKGDPNGSTSKRLLAVVRIVTEGNCSCVSYRCLHSSTLLREPAAISIQNIQRRMVERGAAFTFIRDALMCPQKQQLLTTHCFPPLPLLLLFRSLVSYH